MTRRDFARLGTTVCASPVNQLLSRGSGYLWNLGIITDQVDLDLDRVLNTFYKKYDLRWAEIRNLQLNGRDCYVYSDATKTELRRVRQRLRDAGLRVSVVDTAVYKCTLPGTTPIGEIPAYITAEQIGFSRQLDDVRRAADVAHTLGTDRIRIFTFRRVAKPHDIFGRIVEQLELALDVARQHDVILLIENEYDCNIGTAAETANLLKAITDRRLMHNWDLCNAYEMGERPFPDSWNQLDHSRISHIHLKDAKGKEWRPIGAGDIDFVGQFHALREMKYSGTLSVETRYRNARQDSYASSVESMDGLMRILRDI